jgi:hypothetical protein
MSCLQDKRQARCSLNHGSFDQLSPIHRNSVQQDAKTLDKQRQVYLFFFYYYLVFLKSLTPYFCFFSGVAALCQLDD